MARHFGGGSEGVPGIVKGVDVIRCEASCLHLLLLVCGGYSEDSMRTVQ